MFVQSAKFIENRAGSISDISVYGQDSNPTTWKMAHMNLAIRGIEANLGDYAADTFHDDRHPTLKADFIMANPPFNISKWGANRLQDDVRWKYGTPPDGNANFAWIQHMIHHLAPGGRIGLVLANGSLSSQTGGEGDIRRRIVEADLVEGIVAMPSQLFYTATIPVSLWFLTKDKQQKGKILFVDARKMGSMVDRRLRILNDTDICKIAQTFSEFRAGKLHDEHGFCAVVSASDIADQEYVLTPGRFIEADHQEDEDYDFDEVMEQLTSELSELFTSSQILEDEVRKQLGKLNFVI